MADVGAESVSTKRRTLGVFSSPRPRAPNGEPLCYNCHGPMPPDKRKFNCSPKCAEEWRCKTSPGWMRHVVFKRDRGICAECGCDTDALKAQYDAIVKPGVIRFGDIAARREFRAEHGIPESRATGDWWDVDHIRPVIEGGGECGLDNLRTLCIPCHKRVTRELAQRRARMRHDLKAIELDAARPLLQDLI